MGKVTPEVRQRIVKLRETNSAKQIVEILKEDGISIIIIIIVRIFLYLGVLHNPY